MVWWLVRVVVSTYRTWRWTYIRYLRAGGSDPVTVAPLGRIIILMNSRA